MTWRVSGGEPELVRPGLQPRYGLDPAREAMNASGVAVSAPTKPEIVMSGKEARDQALFTGTASIDMAVSEGASATHRHAARVASPGARGDDLQVLRSDGFVSY